MPLPYQCIQACNRSTGDSHEWTLFGASGSRLVVQSSSGGTSTWPEEEANPRDEQSEDEPQEPPGKKIKLSPPADQTSNFSCLALSNDSQYLVAITAEDKCIRVFQIDSKCRLRQLSKRCMARRPCSITLTSDDSTILCADKFGDVYALPLHQAPEDERDETPASEQSEVVAQKQFVPAASVLTVHSGRNRKVLEEQMKQASKGQVKLKESLRFKHDLLLGHVSMLTDVAYTTVDSKSYILTADRDEHIRISRGPPQAHIIEGFCQGHDEFVSRLCVTKSGLLVSGGGDPYLIVWDWLNYRIVEKVCLRDVVLDHYKAQPQLASTLPEDDGSFKIAVTGIWSVPSSQSKKDEILVACEGVPALFSFKLGESATSGEVISLSGNALDVTFLCPTLFTCIAVVAVDNVHKPGSTTKTRDDEGPFRLEYFSNRQDGQWREDTTAGESLEWFSRRAPDGESRNEASWEARSASKASTRRVVDEKALRDILYGVGNLRKRPGAED